MRKLAVLAFGADVGFAAVTTPVRSDIASIHDTRRCVCSEGAEEAGPKGNGPENCKQRKCKFHFNIDICLILVLDDRL